MFGLKKLYKGIIVVKHPWKNQSIAHFDLDLPLYMTAYRPI